MESVYRATDPMIKPLVTKLLMNSDRLKNSVGSDGGVSSRLRNNIIMKTDLKKRIAEAEANKPNILDIREKTLAFTEKMRVQTGKPYGRYRYCPSGHAPILYASVYACLTRYLYNDLAQLSNSEKNEWINYIQRHQCDDGLFRDAAVSNQLAEDADWWGWRHLTLHTVMALDALGAVTQKPLDFLKEFKSAEKIAQWLKTRDWNGNVANVSNEIQNYCAMLQYARDFRNEFWTENALNSFYTELDKLQNTKTGSWGNKTGNRSLLSITVQTGYHIWILYFYDKKQIRFSDKIIDCCLGTQNDLGGFGSFMNTSACEDIDSLDPIVRLHDLTSYRQDDIETACERAVPWILANMNPDGGFVFRRNEPFLYGHENMFTGINESSMFPTWFRSLSLAYIAKITPKSQISGFSYKFLNCPGYQFWRK